MVAGAGAGAVVLDLLGGEDSSSESSSQATSSSAAGVDAGAISSCLKGEEIWSYTFEHFASPLLFALDDVAEEIVSAPEGLVFRLLGHAFLHCGPEFCMLF